MTHRASTQADGYASTIADIVAAIIADQLGEDVENIRPGMVLVDDLGADSLDLDCISLELEERFHLGPISDAETTAMRCVADVVAFVERRLGAANAITS